MEPPEARARCLPQTYFSQYGRRFHTCCTCATAWRPVVQLNFSMTMTETNTLFEGIKKPICFFFCPSLCWFPWPWCFITFSHFPFLFSWTVRTSSCPRFQLFHRRHCCPPPYLNYVFTRFAHAPTQQCANGGQTGATWFNIHRTIEMLLHVAEKFDAIQSWRNIHATCRNTCRNRVVKQT